MPRDALLALGTRASAGRGLWSVVSFAVPSASLLDEEHYGVAVLLFVAETLIALALLGVRLTVAWRASADELAVRDRLRKTRRNIPGVLVMTAVGLVWATAMAALTLGVQPPDDLLGVLAGRLQPLALGLLAAALLDTIIAPVRSPVWLETGIAWQASRASVVLASILFGLPFAAYFGVSALLWSFLGLRLIADLGGMTRGERERIRSLTFDSGGSADSRTLDRPKAPPTFVGAHARHDVRDPRRLPD